MQQIVSGSAIESALYRMMDLPGLRTLYPRPPAEARAELSNLIQKSSADPDLYALRAHADEQSLDFTAAEQDWKAYAGHAKDTTAAQLDLADYYRRRLQSQQEITTLNIVAAAPTAPSEKFTPAQRQRAWRAFQRILQIASEQALPPELVDTTYKSWIARYPLEPSVYAAAINSLIQQQRFDEAGTVIEAYKKSFPNDAVFPVKATALVEYRRGSLDKALDLYESNFQPLWPAELIQSYYGMLAAQHAQRRVLADSRARLVTNPDDLAAAARIFFYYQQQGNLSAAARAFDEYRLSKDQRHALWTPDELYTIATLLNNVGLYSEAARYDFALYNTAGKLTVIQQSPQEAALSSIANILFTAPEQSIDLGSGNLSIYRDIATTDRGPGYLNGILSLWLNSSNPASAMHEEEQRAAPYFRRAKAAEILALLDKNFPTAPTRPDLHAALIRAYVTYGDDPAVIKAGTEFLTAFRAAPQHIPVAMLVADAYARTKNTTAEFALYDQLLTELARDAQGMPLTASADSSAPPAPTLPADQSDDATPRASKPVPNQDQARALDLTVAAPVPPAPDDLSYSQILERYLGRLTTEQKLPEALAVLRRELDRNPDDPLLYVRIADFLQQNNFAAQQEEVYRRAIAHFPGTTFYDKLARFYIRQQRQQDFATLTRQVVDTFHGTELEAYFSNVNHGWPQVYLQLNLYAHQRFPHDLNFTRNLLVAYRTRGTTDDAAWELLLRQHWSESEDLRNQFFDYLSRTGKLDAELAQLQTVAPTEAQQQQNPAATHELAELDLWQSHFEASAPLFGNLAHAYPADTVIGDQASSVFRSLAYFDPRQTARAVSIQQNLTAADPANLDRLARIGDIYADSVSTDIPISTATQLATAAPYWRRIPTVHPGEPDGYLQSATIFWDYFQFDSALTEIAAARKQFHDPVLYGYEAGAIYENKNDPAQAVAEYVAASVTNQPSGPARNRLLALANRPAYTQLIEAATAKAVAANPDLTTLSLRADILAAHRQQAGIAPLIAEALTHATTTDQAAQLSAFAHHPHLRPSYQQALQREITLSADPVQRIELQYSVAQSYEQSKDLASAQRIIESVYKDNPRLLGVVRTTTDFYWDTHHPREAIATLVQASHEANPDLAKSFTLEAASKSNQSADYAGARTLLAPLLTQGPYNPSYLAVQADSFALANDNTGLRDFYNATLATLKTANMPAEDRRDKTALLRKGLIQAYTHLNDYPAAVDQYIALISAFPEDSNISQTAALYALRYDRRQQLVDFLNKTVTASPRDSRFAITLGRVDTIFEDYPGAVAAYTKAIAIRIDRADIYMARADIEEHQQNFDAACADYDRIYLLTYKDPQWMLKSAEARARQGKNDLAVRALQAAWIDGRPASAQNSFLVAAQLEKWNLLTAARTFAEQGIKLATDKDPADLLAAPENHDGTATYVRILTRQRQTAEALALLQKTLAASATLSPNSPALIVQQAEQQGVASVTDAEWRGNLIKQRTSEAQASFQNALNRMGTTVAEYFTPEEKLAYAQLLDAQSAGKPDQQIATVWIPAAQAAGLKDREAQWRKDVLLKGERISADQLPPYNELETQRLENANRARTLEAYAAKIPARARPNILAMAADAWAEDVNTASELRILRTLNLQSSDRPALRDRFFRLLLDTDQKTLLAQTSSSNEAYADAAANFILLRAPQPLAYTAIDTRAHTRPPVWGSANTALAGLFFADKSPRIETSFHTALADATIGERLTHPANRDQQIIGADWFYYGTRYGVYRTIAPVPEQDPEDFLPANLEANSSAVASYINLAETYRDVNQPEAAVREYNHALELTPRTASIHRAIAVTLWPVDTPATNKTEATDQWKTALALLRALVDVRAVPESFWTDFATITSDLYARNLGPQFQSQMDAVLRAYITKNGDYRSAELLQSAFTAQPTDAGVDWIFSLASAARNPAPLFAQLDAPWFPRNQLGRLYRYQLELAESAAAAQPAANATDNNDIFSSNVIQARIKLLNWLLAQKNNAEAQTLYNTIPATQRQQDSVQQIRIELAARQNQIPALLADFTTNPITTPDLNLIQSAANRLRTEGNLAANRLLLEYTFQQKFERYQLTPTDFLSLAQARFDSNTPADTASAIALLHRLIMLPANGNQDIYTNIDSAASLLEHSNHAAEALPFLTTLSNATPWNSAYRLRLAQAQLKTQQNTAARANLTAVASTSTVPYDLRTQAATTLHSTLGTPSVAKTFDSVELTLLASNATITAQQASQSYFLPARVVAASSAPAAAKPAILYEAIAVSPNDNLRLAIFRAEFALNHNDRALAVIRPLLESSGGYARNFNQSYNNPSDDSPPPTQDFNPATQPNADQSSSARPLPILLHTREEKITFALAIATLYEKNGDAPKAAAYLSTASTLDPDAALSKVIATRLAAAQTSIRIDAENNARRPVIQPTLNQPVIVRPQIVRPQVTLAAAKQVQP